MRFTLRVGVSDEFLRADPSMARALARTALSDQAERLRGPRGGRYVAVTPLSAFFEGQRGNDWMRYEWSVMASVDARYVRPGDKKP